MRQIISVAILFFVLISSTLKTDNNFNYYPGTRLNSKVRVFNKGEVIGVIKGDKVNLYRREGGVMTLLQGISFTIPYKNDGLLELGETIGVIKGRRIAFYEWEFFKSLWETKPENDFVVPESIDGIFSFDEGGFWTVKSDSANLYVN